MKYISWLLINKINYLFVLVCSGIVLSSCNNGNNVKRQPVHITYQKRQDTKQFRLLITNTVKSDLDYAGQSQIKTSKTTLGAGCEVMPSSPDTLKLKLTYDSLFVELDNKGKKTVINAANGSQSFDPVERILSSILGSSIILTLNAKNEIISVEGNKELADKLRVAVNDYDESAKAIINDQVNKLAGDDFVKNHLAQLYTILPDTLLTVGDKWSDTTIQTSEIPLRAISNYSLAGVSNDDAEVKVESVLQSIPNASDLRSGPGFMTDLSGTQKGTLHVDTKTGLLSHANIEASIKGPIDVMGSEGMLKVTTTKQLVVIKD